ncbi:putative anion transporter 4, chloroplastic [Sarracenia purpurea var. burkii]
MQQISSCQDAGASFLLTGGLYYIDSEYEYRVQGVLLGLSNTAGVLAGVFGTAATGYILQKGAPKLPTSLSHRSSSLSLSWF